MPTGYTDPVRKGEVTDLRPFIELCAHAVMPSMYDRSMHTPLPTSVTNTDRVKELQDEIGAYKLQLHGYRMWSLADAAVHQDSSFHQALTEWRESEEKRIADLARYEAMLAQVRAWEVTEPIQGLKNFMIEQLESSIKFDCTNTGWGKPVYRTPEEYKRQKIESVKLMISRRERYLEEELERQATNQAWLDEFYKVLPKV